MLQKIQKVSSNLGLKAYKVLGPKLYLKYILTVLKNSITIISSGNMIAVDRKIGQLNTISITSPLGKAIRFNLNLNDAAVENDAPSFGLIRELFIRNCYKINKQKKLQTIVDLGGNRGVFSLLCSSFAKEVHIVEMNEKYNECIERNLRENGFKNFTITNKFIGSGGLYDDPSKSKITFREFIKMRNIDNIDLLKVDIEGSEFALFNEEFPFEKIRFITMEIHHACGNVSSLIEQLERNNFTIRKANSLLQSTDNPKMVDFIYAVNNMYT